MPLLAEPPLAPADVPRLDALLVTHIDSDHFSRATCKSLSGVCKAYHAPHYVARQMKTECGIDGVGHDIGDCFSVGGVQVTLTPVCHTWQNDFAEYAYRKWMPEDYCGYWFDTPDGTVWVPGDSRLMEEHLAMNAPDVILFDFSDDSWHIGFENAVKLANAYPGSRLICIHWGCIDAPDMPPFNPDPRKLFGRVSNPERIYILAPGEEFTL